MLSFVLPDMIVISISSRTVLLKLGRGGVPFEHAVFEGLQSFPFHGELLRPPSFGKRRWFGKRDRFVACCGEGLVECIYGSVNIMSSLNRVQLVGGKLSGYVVVEMLEEDLPVGFFP